MKKRSIIYNKKGAKNMSNVMIQKEEEWYVAKCVDNNVASQGKTIDEALKNLKEALELYLQNEEVVQPKETYLTTLEVAI